ncbi:MAG: hypothetical protein Q8N03_12605 [Ignavibacteria bacterium]|nr:hypothetical protein [Ignavibacteria bacterium]
MNLLKKIFDQEEFKIKPPVLIDIGASGHIHYSWKKIAPYSICVAFDADNREFKVDDSTSKGFKKLYTFNALVSDVNEVKTNFFLTRSPYCSSALKPDQEKLNKWAFAEKFIVDSSIQLNSTTINNALKQIGIDYIDWFKTDSQGMDLRLFRSLGNENIKNILGVEMEPGIIDSYIGEDKLPTILNFMSGNGFWLADIIVKGSQRISNKTMSNISASSFYRKVISFSHKKSPGWTELLFFNEIMPSFTKREFMLAWVFAIIQKQYGFAYEIVEEAKTKYPDSIFSEMMKKTKYLLMFNLFNLNLLKTVKEKISKMLSLD